MKRKHRRSRRDTESERKRAQALLRLGVTDPREVHLKTVVRKHVQRVVDATDNSIGLTAELLAVNRRTVERLRKEGAIRVRKKRIRARPKPKAARPRIDAHRVVELRKAGATWDRIAEELGCSAFGAQLAAKRLMRTER